jgi:hypothetical protein
MGTPSSWLFTACLIVLNIGALGGKEGVLAPGRGGGRAARLGQLVVVVVVGGGGVRYRELARAEE